MWDRCEGLDGVIQDKVEGETGCSSVGKRLLSLWQALGSVASTARDWTVRTEARKKKLVQNSFAEFCLGATS